MGGILITLLLFTILISNERKFVDLAKAQAQEIAFLRSEIERLRMKAFPA